jgi:hypothetical protein
MSPSQIQSSEFTRDLLNNAVRMGEDPAKLRSDLKTSARRVQTGINTAGIPLALTAAGGLGGMLGGGVGNVGQLVGIPGLQQGMPVDPESYGSSNSPGARYKAPTMQYM